MLGDKVRFRFAKAGTLRLLSHHDLMRCLERMLRRADLPFASTAGFHPGPRLVFALSLPLGVVGRDEVMELELTRPLDAADVLARLNAQAPDGLTFLSAAVVPKKATATPRRVVYTLPLPPDRIADTAARAADLLAQEKVWVDRLKPSPKRLNIRPYLRGLSVVRPPRERERAAPLGGHSAPPEPTPGQPPAGRADHIRDTLTLDLWVTQTGTARADELVRLLGLTDLLDAGAVLERARVEIRDEVPAADPADGPPDGPADTLPLGPAAAAAARDDSDQPAAAHPGASPDGPVLE